MPSKTKTKTTTDQLSSLAQQGGLLLMTAAITLGMLELPEHPNSKIVLPSQPAFAMANENEEMNNPIRREKEESAPHYMSYSVAQRTQSRSGRH